MNIFWSIFLGILQGLTEFIPVSSSGHLVLAQSLIPNFSQPGVLFDVVLHLATLIAVFYFFRKTIFGLSRRYLMLLIIGTIPAALVGFFFQSQLEKMFGAPKTLGLEFLITGFLNVMVDRVKTVKKAINPLNAFTIGIGQAIAIIPGISRSGATIFAGVKLGVDREKAAEFSFLLSIPAILGANILQLFTHGLGGIQNPSFYIIGFIFALISGYLSIGVVYKFLLGNKFKFFGYWCFLIGAIAILFLK